VLLRVKIHGAIAVARTPTEVPRGLLDEAIEEFSESLDVARELFRAFPELVAEKEEKS
jgi:hypothetical protein